MYWPMLSSLARLAVRTRAQLCRRALAVIRGHPQLCRTMKVFGVNTSMMHSFGLAHSYRRLSEAVPDLLYQQSHTIYRRPLFHRPSSSLPRSPSLLRHFRLPLLLRRSPISSVQNHAPSA
ncbi:hypothetical protein B0H14DRAFT_1373586 [Mycena olivaceomarginata]|nr:hypothetical protein B0H14DRAFT_1373586 [Mycena olivaceomarginata]